MVGVIDWALAYRGNTEMRRDYNLAHLYSQVKDTEPLPLSVRKEYASSFSQIVNDGIDSLKKTLSLRPNDGSASIYLSLLYRRTADLAQSDAQRAGLMKEADNLLAKANSLNQALGADVRFLQYPGIAPPPPPALLVSRVSQGTRVVVGGQVEEARLVNRVQPVYPPLARQTRISGTVRLHAIIGTDGTVQELEVIDGHPLLIQAAIDSVKQWRYQPTLLEGRPVEVDTEIDVVFNLAQ
jgi:TonB family protein